MRRRIVGVVRVFRFRVIVRLLGKTWISTDNNIAQNILGVLLAIPTLIVAIIIKLIILPFERPKEISSKEVRDYLQDMINASGTAFDWDDFTSIRIKNPELEKIRSQASEIELPINEAGKQKLRDLLKEIEILRSKPTYSASPLPQ